MAELTHLFMDMENAVQSHGRHQKVVKVGLCFYRISFQKEEKQKIFLKACILGKNIPRIVCNIIGYFGTYVHKYTREGSLFCFD